MTVDRIRIWLSIAMLGLVSLGSFWVWELMRRHADNDGANASTRTHPDYYIEDFNFIRLSTTGESSYRVSGKSLTHYPREDEYKIITPHIIGLDKNKTPINLRADSAIVQQQVRDEKTKEMNDEIHLFGDVTFERLANENTQALHLISPYLLFLPNKKIVRSDQEITITTPSSQIHAVGLFADYANDKLRLLSHVNIDINPKQLTTKNPH